MPNNDLILCRRRQRSETTAAALDFQLTAVAERFAFDDLVLATPEGFVLAGAGEAGQGPGIETIDLEAMRTLAAKVDGVDVHGVEIGGVNAYVVAIAETRTDTRLAIAQIESGAERILARTTPTGQPTTSRQVVVL